MLKKTILKIVNAISVVIIVLAVLILLNVTITKKGEVPNVMGYSVFRILTGSMEPTIPTNSMIITKRVDAEEVGVGDVVTFYSQDPDLGGNINTHRVVEIKNNGEEIQLITKGDANHVADEYPVEEEDLVGVVVFQSKGVGTFLRLITNPLIFFPLIILPLLIILIKNIVSTIKIAQNIADEEEKEALKEILETVQKHKHEQKNIEGQKEEKSLDVQKTE